MALPRLNEAPKYDIIIPSTKTKTRFRPYLVKEEKVLLLAMESGDTQQISHSVIDLIVSCVDNISAKDLTTYDMDYLFCQIRSKSVGETSKLLIRCEDDKCNHNTEVTIDISKAGVDLNKKIENMIQITPQVTIEMKHLSYYEALKIIDADKSETATVDDTVLKCLKAIYTEDERFDLKDETEENIKNFIEQMTSSQYMKLKQFVASTPQVTLKTEWDCKGCGKHQSITLKGLQDFFQ